MSGSLLDGACWVVLVLLSFSSVFATVHGHAPQLQQAAHKNSTQGVACSTHNLQSTCTSHCDCEWVSCVCGCNSPFWRYHGTCMDKDTAIATGYRCPFPPVLHISCFFCMGGLLSSQQCGVNSTCSARGVCSGTGRCPPYQHAAIPFTWEDPQATPNTTHFASLSSFDDAELGVALPFTVRPFCRNFTSLYIHTNGLLRLGSPIGATAHTNGQSLPPFTVAGLWDDWVPSSHGDIYGHVAGSMPNRRVIISYVNLSHFDRDIHERVSFQVVFYEQSDVVDVRYHDVSHGNVPHSTATIGVAGEHSADTVLVAFNNGTVNDREAFRFSPMPTASPTAAPTFLPSVVPTSTPVSTSSPTTGSSGAPTNSNSPTPMSTTLSPTPTPTTSAPTSSPVAPSAAPTQAPTPTPGPTPKSTPTASPSLAPTPVNTNPPPLGTNSPTVAPTQPSVLPPAVRVVLVLALALPRDTAAFIRQFVLDVVRALQGAVDETQISVVAIRQRNAKAQPVEAAYEWWHGTAPTGLQNEQTLGSDTSTVASSACRGLHRGLECDAVLHVFTTQSGKRTAALQSGGIEVEFDILPMAGRASPAAVASQITEQIDDTDGAIHHGNLTAAAVSASTLPLQDCGGTWSQQCSSDASSKSTPLRPVGFAGVVVLGLLLVFVWAWRRRSRRVAQELDQVDAEDDDEQLGSGLVEMGGGDSSHGSRPRSSSTAGTLAFDDFDTLSVEEGPAQHTSTATTMAATTMATTTGSTTDTRAGTFAEMSIDEYI